eukprot:jgi/Mesvir1/8619/Mv04948-RA.1
MSVLAAASCVLPSVNVRPSVRPVAQRVLESQSASFRRGCPLPARTRQVNSPPSSSRPLTMGLFGLGSKKKEHGGVPPGSVGDESIMSKKAHGSCDHEPMKDLRYNCDWAIADKIGCFNRKYAEHSNYWRTKTTFLTEVNEKTGEVTFYDSLKGKPVFIAPRGRTFEEWMQESIKHGWPSFRDQETVWENIRVLHDGECVTPDGYHLGHNIPDSKGDRFCINLCCVAGNPRP